MQKNSLPKPLLKIIAHASVAHEPEWFTSAPSKAITKVLEKASAIEKIDLWEIMKLLQLQQWLQWMILKFL